MLVFDTLGARSQNAAISEILRRSHGEQMNKQLINAYNKFTSATDRSPGVIDEGEARSLVAIATDINKKSGCCSSGDKGSRELEQLFREHKDVFEPAAASVIGEHLELNPDEFTRGSRQWAWQEALRGFKER